MARRSIPLALASTRATSQSEQGCQVASRATEATHSYDPPPHHCRSNPSRVRWTLHTNQKRLVVECTSTSRCRRMTLHPIGLGLSLGLIVTAVCPTPAAAQFSDTHFEVTLLETDALVIATVSSLRSDKSEARVRVGLSEVRTVWSRYDEPIQAFDVVARMHEGSQTVRFGHHLRLDEGSRYIFLFRNEGAGYGPMVTTNVPVYLIRDDGTLACGGGEIYAIGAFGMFCSTAEQQFGRPLSEETFVRQVLERRRAATRHRPGLARRHERRYRHIVPPEESE